MKERVEIWLQSSITSDIKHLSIQKTTSGLFLLLFIFLFCGASFIGYDYFRLKRISFHNTTLNQTIIKQNNDIKHQRDQIQIFASELENLKHQVDTLSKFEDKVRIVAGIKQTSNSNGLIGIGGIPRDELDPDIPLEKNHNSLIREMHQQATQTNFAAQKQALDFEHLIKILEEKRNLLASTPSIKPIDGWITSRFGYRVSPFTGRKEFHSGLDISNRNGTEIIATANGRISYAAEKMYIGNMVMIDHGHGIVTKYGHMKKLLVKQGQQVKRGDVIGLVGNTGRSTGPHVHYEVRVNGAAVNPLNYILN